MFNGKSLREYEAASCSSLGDGGQWLPAQQIAREGQQQDFAPVSQSASHARNSATRDDTKAGGRRCDTARTPREDDCDVLLRLRRSWLGLTASEVHAFNDLPKCVHRCRS